MYDVSRVLIAKISWSIFIYYLFIFFLRNKGQRKRRIQTRVQQLHKEEKKKKHSQTMVITLKSNITEGKIPKR
jgi:hypothetical protein